MRLGRKYRFEAWPKIKSAFHAELFRQRKLLTLRAGLICVPAALWGLSAHTGIWKAPPPLLVHKFCLVNYEGSGECLMLLKHSDLYWRPAGYLRGGAGGEFFCKKLPSCNFCFVFRPLALCPICGLCDLWGCGPCAHIPSAGGGPQCAPPLRLLPGSCQHSDRFQCPFRPS